MADPPIFTLPDFLCIEIPGLPDPCKALLPGDVTLEDPDLLALLGPALAPLAPLFTILEVIVAIKNCIDAIPEAISTVSPQPIVDCQDDLARVYRKLLRLLPQVSIPAMIVQVIDCIIARITKLRAFLVRLQLQLARIAAVVDLAAELGDANLSDIAVCGSDRLGITLSNEMKGLIALGRLLGLLALFFDLLGIPVEIPDLSELAASPLDEAIEPLDELLAQLQALRALVPPDLLAAAGVE